jgi:hypothetical protein
MRFGLAAKGVYPSWSPWRPGRVLPRTRRLACTEMKTVSNGRATQTWRIFYVFEAMLLFRGVSLFLIG